MAAKELAATYDFPPQNLYLKGNRKDVALVVCLKSNDRDTEISSQRDLSGSSRLFHSQLIDQIKITKQGKQTF